MDAAGFPFPAGEQTHVINVSDLRRGIGIELDNKIYSVIEFQHIKVGRGGAQARLKLRDLRSGAIFDRTFSASEKFRRIRIDRKPVTYLYVDGDTFHFMDRESYDQISVSRAILGDAVNYLKDSMQLEVNMYGEEPIGVELPLNLVMTVTQTDPGFKGDTATGGTKPATVETGLVVNVPLFVNSGDRIKVDTRDGSYIERAQ
jgi:elongation factor P